MDLKRRKKTEDTASKNPKNEASVCPDTLCADEHGDGVLLISEKEYGLLTDDEKARYEVYNEKYERLPKFCFVFLGIGAFSAILYIAGLLSEDFSNFYNRYIAQFFRMILAKISGVLPFSIAELLLISLPLIAFVLLFFGFRKRCETWRASWCFVGSIFSVFVLLFSVFILNFALGYRTSPLSKKLDIEQKPVSADELYDTAVIIHDELEKVSSEIGYDMPKDENGRFSIMPYSLEEMNKKLLEAYDKYCAENDYIATFDSRLKPVMLSNLMSYTHVTGVYSFFTGEANLNVAFPDYTIPYTAAHELAHQRGIAREDEANMVAYLVCIGSDDPYIRYSAYLNMFEYILNPLYDASPEKHALLLKDASTDVVGEIIAFNKFYEKYEKSGAATVSGAINDTFLKMQGTQGSVSYGMVVDLTVAYYKAQKSK